MKMRNQWDIRAKFTTAASALVCAGTCAPALAAEYSWNKSGNVNWTETSAWTPASTVGGPTSADSILTPTSFGGLLINRATAQVTDWTFDSSSSWNVIGQNGTSPAATVAISGTLSKAGGGTLTFRGSGSGNPLQVSVGNLSQSAGNLAIGADGNPILGFTAGSATLSGGTLSLIVGATSGVATVNGNLQLGGAATVNVRGTSGNSAQAGTLTVGSLSSTDATPVLRVNGNTSVSASGIINLNGASGTASYAGTIVNGGTASNLMSVSKQGNSTQVFRGANTYSNGTTINGGALLLNNLAGSGAGSGAVAVGVDGTLGGTGRLSPSGSNGITVSGTIAPGGADAGDAIESLEINLSATTGLLNMLEGSGFEVALAASGLSIASPGISDVILITGASAGDVTFSDNDVDFGGTGAAGWYKIFDTDLAVGTTWNGLALAGREIVSGLSVTNLPNGLGGTLWVGDGTNGDYDDLYVEIVAAAVPEPTSIGVLASVLFGSLCVRPRRLQAATTRAS